MYAEYRLKPEELNENFFNILRETFMGKEAAVTVVVTTEEIADTTEYLLSNEANRAHLLKSVEDSKNGRSVHTMTIEEMEAMVQ
ncbi:hypothetical protein FACS1894147_03610 [Spirochaetia bacterium]|nr:hypothetical protein FACS1894147_03610 [Spirochaetia bacterium]